jgi:hypothetical protein
MRSELEDYEEIGGSCRTEYTCDICEEREYQWDEWGVNITGMIRIFRAGDKDMCEYCLGRLLEATEEEILKSLE